MTLVNKLVSIDSKIYKENEAVISAYDRGFLFGDSLFETMVSFSGTILNFTEHLKRLRKSADLLEIDFPWSDSEILDECNNLLDKFSSPKLRLRIQISRGKAGNLVYVNKNSYTTNKIIFADIAPLQKQEVYDFGISLAQVNTNTIAEGSHIKTANYLPGIIALKKAREQGFDDLLWINSKNEITESSTANIFFIGRDGDNVFIETPALESGLLPGLTREKMIQLLINAKIPILENRIMQDEVSRFDEAFITSSVRGIVPVYKIGSKKLYTIRTNSIFSHLSRLYLTWVETQLGHRVDWNTGRKLSY